MESGGDGGEVDGGGGVSSDSLSSFLFLPTQQQPRTPENPVLHLGITFMGNWLQVGNGLDTPLDGGMEFYITDEKGTVKKSKISMNEPLAINGELRLLHVLVCWSEKQIKKYDTQLCSSLPVVFKSGFFAKRPQESASLYKCLEAFLQEEPLLDQKTCG